MKTKKFFKRVDVQVIILVVISLLVVSIAISTILYKVTYDLTIDNVHHHAQDTLDLIKGEIKEEDFNLIKKEEDINHPRYVEIQKEFEYIAKATGFSYVFTAYKDDEGIIRHHVSNLYEDSLNYRKPGQEVDNLTHDKLVRTFEGEIIMKTQTKSFNGSQYLSCYAPLYNDEGEIIGTIGLIFDATRQFEAYRNIRIALPIIISLSIVIISIISFVIFKRISNPSFQDLSNTDFMTGLKNRNAYQLDLDNMNGKNEKDNVAVVLFDLNGLKKLNDDKGHDAGDEFIVSFAKAYLNIKKKVGVMYRIGGDEFILIIQDASKEIIKKFLKDFKQEFYNLPNTEHLTYSVGYAIYDPKDGNLNVTIRRADLLMYRFKRENN
jgi:diguanylate cyclase (GGDEF)-like protein